jgi:hypothetical protein
MIILDTNVLSEVFRPSPSPAVLLWLAAREPHAVFTTAITQAEVLLGLEMMPAGRRRTRLSAAIEAVFAEDLRGRVLPFDEAAARLYPAIVTGRTALGRPVAQSGGLIAAIARAHRAVVATRNTRGFEHCGIRLINPWRA